MTATASKEPRRTQRRAPQNGGFTVNRTLTTRRERECHELGSAVIRLLRALSKRAEAGDLQALNELRKIDSAVALEMLRAALALNREAGYSWTEVGLAAGLSKQAAHHRWGRE